MDTTNARGKTPQLVQSISGLQALEDRRRLAVQRVLEGESQVEVARSLKVSARAVRYWMEAYRTWGEDGIRLRKAPGATPKLSDEQAREVCGWLLQDATTFGFRTNLWTSPRIAKLIQQKFNVQYNANYLCDWLRRHDCTLQKPVRRASQRDESKIQRWIQRDWPAIVKKGRTTMPTSF